MATSKWLGVWTVGLSLALAITAQGCGASDTAEAATETRDNDKKERDDRGKHGEAAGDDEGEEAVPVEVAALEHGPIESVLRLSSNLEAENQVQVFSQAKRLVRELRVEEGDRVRRDDVLLRLQDDEQRSQLAKVKSQRDKAEREFRRQQQLFEQELVSQQVYADARFEFEQLEIAVADAERELGYTEVRAPIAGTVSQRLVKVGDQVQIGQHLFDIVDFDSLVARVFVPEKHLDGLRPGLEARISGAATGDRSHVATVARVAPIVDAKSGTVKVTVAVGAADELRPGLYVDVDLVMATRGDAVLVPKRALVYDADQMFVYRLGAERRVERIFIEPGLVDDTHVEPRAGLAAGDLVVIAGQAGLKDQALVRLPGDADPDERASDATDEAAVTAEKRGA